LFTDIVYLIFAQVADLCQKLPHSGPDKLKTLQTLRQACAQGTLYIDALFGYVAF